MNYSFQSNMALHFKILKKDVVQTPFSFKFGKTNTSNQNTVNE